MSMFGKDRDEEYQDYLNGDGSMFGKMDRQEFDSIKDRALEIHTGLTMGTFERDEKVWEEVKKLKENE